MSKVNITTIQLNLKKKLNEKYKNPILSNQYSWWILEAITGKKKEKLIINSDKILTNDQLSTLDDWFDKLFNKSMPLQYLLGTVPFLNLEIIIEPPTLIPRPETEELVAEIINQLKKLNNQKIKILDIGTGSGCIALALAKAFPNADIFGVDIAENSIELAIRNSEQNKIKNISFIHSDLFKNIPQGLIFDLIISNPPYISQEEWNNLDDSVTQWEDKKALIAEKNGTAIIEKIVNKSHSFLKQNEEMKKLKIPQLILEIGYKQSTIVSNLLEKAGYNDITIKKDLEGKDRVVTGRINHVAISTKKQ